MDDGLGDVGAESEAEKHGKEIGGWKIRAKRPHRGLFILER